MKATLKDLAICPRCGGTGVPTEWLPGSGFEPAMRQFECRSCHVLFYRAVLDNETPVDIKLRAKAREGEPQEITSNDVGKV